MAIYHFSNQIISRKKQQNTVASAAYRSGEKLLDERTNEIKFYKRKMKPVTHILAPSHAPKWVYDRQQLWNEVEKKEKQWNAQLAREINVALPKELPLEQQEQLAIEFCQDIFVRDGMIADLSIHRDDKENPHFHVMLTIRPFNEDGTWGNKQVKVREVVNGKEQIKAVHTTDWNTKEKLFYWREQWANYANRFLEKNGFSEGITHLSNKDRHIDTLPTIHEGFVARDMKRKGKHSDRIQINDERKQYNNVLIELEKAKNEKRIRERNNQFIRRFTPSEKKQLRDAAKVLRMFVNQESIQTRKVQLEKWNKRLEFSLESMDTLKKLNRIEKEREILNKMEVILETEANRFMNHYYPNVDKELFSMEQKMEIVEATVSQNKLFSSNEIQFLCTELKKNQIEKDLHLLLNHRPQFVIALKREMQQAKEKFEHLRSVNQIDFSDPSTIQKVPEKELNRMRVLLKHKTEMEKSLELMDQLYNHQLEEMYPGWEGRNYLTVEQKEYFVMAKEYYGKSLSPEDFSNPERIYSKKEQQEIISVLYKMNTKSEKEHLPQFLKNKYPGFQFDNQSYLNMFYYECLRFAEEIGEENIQHLQRVLRFDNMDSKEAKIGPSDTFSPGGNNYSVLNGSNFFSILEQAIREADRQWREDEYAQRNKMKRIRRKRGMER